MIHEFLVDKVNVDMKYCFGTQFTLSVPFAKSFILLFVYVTDNCFTIVGHKVHQNRSLSRVLMDLMDFQLFPQVGLTVKFLKENLIHKKRQTGIACACVNVGMLIRLLFNNATSLNTDTGTSFLSISVDKIFKKQLANLCNQGTFSPTNFIQPLESVYGQALLFFY